MRHAWIPVLALALLCAGCGGDPDTPEARVRRVLAALEEAVERGDVSDFREHVSERYEDPIGNDRRSLLGLVTFHVMRNSRRHVLVRVHHVELREPDRAEVVLAAGLAGSEAAFVGNLQGLRADVWKIDLDLEEEEDGAWRVVWAQWRRTVAADLL